MVKSSVLFKLRLAAVMQADCVLKPCIDSTLEVEAKLGTWLKVIES